MSAEPQGCSHAPHLKLSVKRQLAGIDCKANHTPLLHLADLFIQRSAGDQV